ncbi:hypothetical protein [Halorussus ruber]|uniref:hypothetical protein n=1 Tax=Halorussus ruber TaxID=1126238 RepID=UPI001B2FFF5A
MRTTGAALVLAVLLAVAPLAASQETATTRQSDLDLREANVVGVEFERGDGDDRSFDVSVTLYHDDDGEPGYADRWQVETLNGTELGRRELLHAHGTRPFTRSERISVPEPVSLVVVRGHDQTHGLGGQAMVVDLRTGATEAVEQGPDARNFSECTAVRRAVSSETTTASATTTTATAGLSSETDLVDCPWEKAANRTTA